MAIWLIEFSFRCSLWGWFCLSYISNWRYISIILTWNIFLEIKWLFWFKKSCSSCKTSAYLLSIWKYIRLFCVIIKSFCNNRVIFGSRWWMTQHQCSLMFLRNILRLWILFCYKSSMGTIFHTNSIISIMILIEKCW